MRAGRRLMRKAGLPAADRLARYADRKRRRSGSAHRGGLAGLKRNRAVATRYDKLAVRH